MMNKKLIKYDVDVSEKILSGVKKTSKIVGETLGPLGNNVILSNNGYTKITKDGITVLRNVSFEDPHENVAAILLREASDKTNSQSGDGTTGTCILAESIYANGLKHTIAGANKTKLRNGIVNAAKKVEQIIRNMAKPIHTKDEIRQVAKISSNHSDEIADVLADTFDKIGENGVIKVEAGNTSSIESKIVEGMQFDNGYISPYFVTNDKMEANLDSPFIFIIDSKISNIQDILTPMQTVSQMGKPILIIAEDVEGDALSTMVLNRMRGLTICAVRAPSYGQNRKNLLQDIAILTGGKVISEDTGIVPNDAVPESGIVGTAKRVIVTRDTTTIIGGAGKTEEIQSRINQLKAQIENCTDEYDLKKFRDRLAKLDGGIGIVSVGGRTESEMKEKKDLVDDAFNACKCAIKEGIVAGGGAALLIASKRLKQYILNELPDTVDEDELTGWEIVCESLEAPIRKILENADEKADVVISKLLDMNVDYSINIGYDVLEKKYGIMIDMGVVDPAAVVISEIQNSSSIASLLLTTSAAIVDDPEDLKKKKEIQPEI